MHRFRPVYPIKPHFDAELFRAGCNARAQAKRRRFERQGRWGDHFAYATLAFSGFGFAWCLIALITRW